MNQGVRGYGAGTLSIGRLLVQNSSLILFYSPWIPLDNVRRIRVEAR